MNSNQRSEMNNQTNNGGNEKGTPGSQGATRGEGPLDHTYPQGASQQQGRHESGHAGTQQSGMGPGLGNEDAQSLPGGSMQTQQSGGTGAVQGITDSHQRAMEQRSGAYGVLEQPGAGNTGTPVGNRQSESLTANGGSNRMNAQDAAQPELQVGSLGTQGGGQRGPLSGPQSAQGGSMGNQQSQQRPATQGGGQAGPLSGQQAQQGDSMGSQHSALDTGRPAVKRGGSMSAQQSSDRAGSQTGTSEQRDAGRMNESNDAAGGLPRSPGNSGPANIPPDTHLTGVQVHANQQKAQGGVHKSNDMTGGLPKSPGGANKLAADEKMDDDTGFSNPDRR